jgi:hypothetical protein
MNNAFGFVLDDASVRRAAVEGVPETVIAAIYLLHERSVEDVASKLERGEGLCSLAVAQDDVARLLIRIVLDRPNLAPCRNERRLVPRRNRRPAPRRPAQLLQGREVEQGWAAGKRNAVRWQQPRQAQRIFERFI